MAELLRIVQMRAAEQAEIASGTVTGLELMERAARGVVAAALREWPHLGAAPARAAILCGPGNNGGDGLAVARLLAERGWNVRVLLAATPHRLPPDARANLQRLPSSVALDRLESLSPALWLRDALERTFDQPLPDGFGARPLPASYGAIAPNPSGDVPHDRTSASPAPDRENGLPDAAHPVPPQHAPTDAASGQPVRASSVPTFSRSTAGDDRPGEVSRPDHMPALASTAEARGDPLAEGAKREAPASERRGADAPAPALLLVDALFGTGLGRPAETVAPLIASANALTAAEGRLHRLAVDIPSGICADSGRLLQPPAGGCHAFAADLTVTFHRARPGHFLAEGAEARGVLAVADIGLPSPSPAPDLRSCEAPAPALLDKCRPSARAHKFSHGHLLVLAGGPGHGGAARLAARAALRIGAGLVTLAPPPEALAENAARLDAIMLSPLPDSAALFRLLEDPRVSALCLGPGLGLGAREAALLAQALQAGRPLVLDADALTLLAGPPPEGASPTPMSATPGRQRPAHSTIAGAPEQLARPDPATIWLARAAPLGEDCVLTPHMGEFARLFPDLAARLAEPAREGPAFSKLDAAQEAAARAGCTLVLKGPDTVIATPRGPATLHAATGNRAAPWLATAGAGDVLAGLIAGLLARGLPALPAAEAAVWLHVETALHFGPGLIAEDLPAALPTALRALGLPGGARPDHA